MNHLIQQGSKYLPQLVARQLQLPRHLLKLFHRAMFLQLPRKSNVSNLRRASLEYACLILCRAIAKAVAVGGNSSALAAAISIANGAGGNSNVLAQALSQAVAQGVNASAVSQVNTFKACVVYDHWIGRRNRRQNI